MSSSSTIYTVGTLLSRAQDAGAGVRVLVEGTWVCGVPLAIDGHGAVLRMPDDGHVLVRMQAITAVAYTRETVVGEAQDVPRRSPAVVS